MVALNGLAPPEAVSLKLSIRLSRLSSIGNWLSTTGPRLSFASKAIEDNILVANEPEFDAWLETEVAMSNLEPPKSLIANGRRSRNKISKTWTLVIGGTVISHLMALVAGTPLSIDPGNSTSATSTLDSVTPLTTSGGAVEATGLVDPAQPVVNAFWAEFKARLQSMLLAALVFIAPAIMISLALAVCLFLSFTKSRSLVAAFMAASGAVYIYIHQDIDLDGVPGVLFG